MSQIVAHGCGCIFCLGNWYLVRVTKHHSGDEPVEGAHDTRVGVGYFFIIKHCLCVNLPYPEDVPSIIEICHRKQCCHIADAGNERLG